MNNPGSKGYPTRILVTGGAGFIGSSVAEMYLAHGCEVTVVDDLSSGRRERVPSGASFIELDVSESEIQGILQRGRFDLVSHHAAQMSVALSLRDPLADLRSNVTGLIRLITCSMECGVKRFVFASSGGEVYGERLETPTPESHRLAPISPYGITKVTGELYLHWSARIRGLDHVSLRYGNVFGPKQDAHGEAGVVAIFSRRVLNGDPITIYGDGEQVRDYVYIDDVVEANWLASIAPMADPIDPLSRVFNIGTGVSTSVNGLAEHIMEAAGGKVERIYMASRPGDGDRGALASSRAEEILGWRARVDLNDGVKRTVDYFRSFSRE